MNIISIIPARGGSKGIPKKNIRLLAGKPLIAYSIIEANKSKFVDYVIVSTEDSEIASIGKKFGAEIIERPKKLAQDDSLTIDVIYHTIDKLKNNIDKDKTIIVLLQPTSPLRTVEDIDNSINLYLEQECESVVSVCKTYHPPQWSLIIENGFLKPLFGKNYFMKQRQTFDDTYFLNGAIYIAKVETLYKYKSFICQYSIPYIMPYDRSIDIDEENDLMLAELLMKREN